MSTTTPASERAAAPRAREVGRMLATGIQAWGLVYAALALLLCAGFALGTTAKVGDFFTIAATAYALAMAGALIGGFLGLLFGMPRQAESPASNSTKARYEFNSNLLKVSDWVTTILVGLSLVSLGSIPGAVSRFADWIAPALGPSGSGGPFGVFIAVASFTVVFLLLYIWTTVPLRGHLEDEAFDIEQLWTSLLGQIAKQHTPEEISETLRSLDPAVLDRIQANPERTPPMLRDLADRERVRRAADEDVRPSDDPEDRSTTPGGGD